MGDRMTESFEPYRPESSYDLDYEEEHPPDRGPRILWGRVVILGLFLLLAFVLGRATVGDSGPSQEAFDRVAAERDDLEEDVGRLEDELAAAEQATAPPATDPADSEGEGATDPEGESEGGETYIVQKDDTLQSIVIDFYGNPDLDDFLAEANDITDPTALSVGQELIIPPEPEE